MDGTEQPEECTVTTIEVTNLDQWGEHGWRWTATVPGDDVSDECRTDAEGEGLWRRMQDGSWSQVLGHLQYDLRPAGDDKGKVAGRIRSLYALRRVGGPRHVPADDLLNF